MTPRIEIGHITSNGTPATARFVAVYNAALDRMEAESAAAEKLNPTPKFYAYKMFPGDSLIRRY